MEKDKKISRLFPASHAPRKKGLSGLGGSCKESAKRPHHLRAALVVVLAVATVFLAFPMPDSLLMSEVADRDVKADRDLMVEDLGATAEKQQAAYKSSPTIFDLDDLEVQEVRDQVHYVFSRGRTILGAPLVTKPIFQTWESVAGPDRDELAALRQRLTETYNVALEPDDFTALVASGFSAQAERAVLQLTLDLMNRGIVATKNEVLNHAEGAVVIRRVYNRQEEPAPYAAAIPSLDEARRLVRDRAAIVTVDFEPAQARALVHLGQALLRSNLIFNERETADRRQTGVAGVKPVYFQVKRGEMIVRVGQRIDNQVRLKLEAQANKADRQDWFPKAAGFFLLTLVFLSVTYFVGFSIGRRERLTDRDFVFLATLLVINLVMAYMATQVGDAMAKGFPGVNKTTIFFLTPAAAGGMLATIFLGWLPGVFYAVVASALTGLVFDRQITMFFFCFVGSIAGLYGLVNVRERGAIVKSGLRVGMVNLGTILALCLIEAAPPGRGLAFYLLSGLLCGVLSGIIVSGLIPLFEMIFKYTTNIKLLELANLDHPVLRDLMVQAPGTYHHSVIVGAMVEAAAEAIGANPLLAKVSAYYHDLGKMNKPLYFVENQTSGENKHERLAPSMSALILTSHVKDGVELARQTKLSPEIADIVQQHHGTSLIAYFYQKAVSSRTDDQPEINIEDYRYPGPKPQTKEAGLVMLADAVEAASRSLGEPNPARVQGMVQKIINNIFSDGQLDECELTLKDLHLIARSFNKILTGIFHRRIAYPEPASKEHKARPADGNHIKQPPKDPQDRPRPGQGPRKENLKRLGMP